MKKDGKKSSTGNDLTNKNYNCFWMSDMKRLIQNNLLQIEPELR